MPPSRVAPVKAPALCPKSSLSMSVSGMAAQLTVTNGLSARLLALWMARAQNPLPVPVSPSSSTEMSRSSTRRNTSTLCIIVGSAERRHSSEPRASSRRATVIRFAATATCARRLASTGACTVANQRRCEILVLSGSAR